MTHPQGTYFVCADFRPFGFDDDVAFARHVTEKIGVAAIPPPCSTTTSSTEILRALCVLQAARDARGPGRATGEAVRVALVQMDLAWEDVPENHRRARRHLEEAARHGARLALLPEMFCTGFSMESDQIAQPAGGPSETFLRATARELSLSVLASLPEAGRRGRATWRSSPAPTARSRGTPRSTRSRSAARTVYTGGDRIVTVTVEGVRVTPLVCYDLRFPEPFRLAAEDTDLFALVANWPEARREHWRTLLRARAIENLCYVAGVNRVGDGGKLHYTGDSAVISPWGEVLAEGRPGIRPRLRRRARRRPRRPRAFPGPARPAARGLPPVNFGGQV